MPKWVPQESFATSRSAAAGLAGPVSLHTPCFLLRSSAQGRHLCRHRCQKQRLLSNRRRPHCSSSPLVTEEEVEEGLQPSELLIHHPPQNAKRRAPIATLRATKAGTLDVEEMQRPLAEYMALPASQYSVLDAERIERLDDNSFRCYVGGLRLFSLVVEPVLTVSVVVGERGPTVKLLETRLQGSPAVEAANDRFSATMTNDVRWSDAAPLASAPGVQRKQLRSDTEIQVALEVSGWMRMVPVGAIERTGSGSEHTLSEVALEVPGWMRMVPVGAIERTGSGVMQRVLDSMVPRFLAQLGADYARWAAGDASRKPIGTGQL